MGITNYDFSSPFSFLMGVLWFSVFVLFSLLLRKFKFTIRVSAIPLLGLLIMSLFRMIFLLEIPGAVIIRSKVIFPAIIDLLQYEIINILGHSVNVLSTLISIWLTMSLFLLIRHFIRYMRSYRTLMALTYARDKEAEAILAGIIENLPTCARVFRTKALKTSVVAGIKPYIFLPEIDFIPEELSVILAHEWKHYQDRDFILNIFTDLIRSVFWWNPLAYLLKQNMSLAIELKSDYFAVSGINTRYYLSGLHKMAGSIVSKEDIPVAVSAFVSAKDELMERVSALLSHDKSHRKRVIVNTIFCIAMVALFLFSYMFLIQPFYPVEQNDMEFSDAFGGEYVYIAGESFILENGDGTYSLYVDGQYVKGVDSINEYLNHFPIRNRSAD